MKLPSLDPENRFTVMRDWETFRQGEVLVTDWRQPYVIRRVRRGRQLGMAIAGQYRSFARGFRSGAIVCEEVGLNPRTVAQILETYFDYVKDLTRAHDANEMARPVIPYFSDGFLRAP